ncbi:MULTISPECIES: membrane protein insertion efficiency factor YidD [Thermoactinomyces]|uniref:Putative membrane protein insertion efficiency factor n=1 Tax=Thermoactinomyces daqus TaxID=1329516 RepID=A0A7W2AH91_9BACL|nr:MULTISPECIES: membrane protein insertion efficiency factor YidD [Thermoactinomyces]MBA4541935.1 membrane protein insertion efficiency factor YidD [Thermoactinomyces daqus]MBH8597934.1 membrane protein insertion efficiency factor YidD [Thermoactinomyces sp. CICC 10523]MBH8604287.1 membrane protein insertion efficiency factor YidD [Thermoactinomyces sp. CICC 10522]MBH8607742.1 membrane protein insertion efficiency factor YidD [Thermoactinomyces sp. CICC 10521]
MKWIALGLIHFYRRFLSPLKPPVCRFVPTCSEYALIAIQRHGFVYGGWLTLRRLLKCHPFHPGGFDYVPEKRQKRPDRFHSDRSSK